MYYWEASEESLNRVSAIASIGLSMAEFLQENEATMGHYISWMQGRCAESGMDPETYSEEIIRESVDKMQEDFERIHNSAHKRLMALDKARELVVWLFS